MPKAGKFEYPKRDLDECIRHLVKASEMKEIEFTRETFADALDLAPSGGGFGALVGSMAQYGLIATGAGNIVITELGKDIVHGEPEDIVKSKSRAIRKIQIFSEIYDRFGTSLNEKQLRMFLRQRAGVDISEVSRIASELHNILHKNFQHLSTLKLTPEDANDLLIEEDIELKGGRGQVTTPFFKISLINRKAIDQAITLLEQFKDDLFPIDSNQTKNDNSKSAEGSEGE